MPYKSPISYRCISPHTVIINLCGKKSSITNQFSNPAFTSLWVLSRCFFRKALARCGPCFSLSSYHLENKNVFFSNFLLISLVSITSVIRRSWWQNQPKGYVIWCLPEGVFFTSVLTKKVYAGKYVFSWTFYTPDYNENLQIKWIPIPL